MPVLEKTGTFYLGNSDKSPLLYESKDLTTHGVIVGMTGSGKTGLGIEACLKKRHLILYRH